MDAIDKTAWIIQRIMSVNLCLCDYILPMLQVFLDENVSLSTVKKMILGVWGSDVCVSTWFTKVNHFDWDSFKHRKGNIFIYLQFFLI